MNESVPFHKVMRYIFNKVSRKQTTTIMMLMLLQAIVEMVGIASFFPFIKLLQEPTRIFNNAYLNGMYVYMGFDSTRNFLVFFGICIFMIFLFRSVCLLLNYHAQAKFVFNLKKKFTSLLIGEYMSLKYEEVSKIHTGEIMKNLLVEIPNSVSCVKQSLLFILNIITAFFIIGSLLFIQPILILAISITVSMIFGIISIYYKPFLLKCSVECKNTNRKLHVLISDTFKCLKDIKANNVENYFSLLINDSVSKLNKYQLFYTYLSTFPGVIINLISFGLLISATLALYIFFGALDAILPILTVIGVAAQRLVPMVNQIYTSWGNMRQYESNVRVVYEQLNRIKSTKLIMNSRYNNESLKIMSVPECKNKTVEMKNNIKIKNLTFSHSGSNQTVLENINLIINKGETIGIVGRSGAGKSTFIDILLGLQDRYHGCIYVDDQLMTNERFRKFREKIGYVAQSTCLIDASVKENIAFGVKDVDVDEVSLNNAIIDSNSSEFLNANLSSSNLGESGSKLSGGQIQRLGFARALYKLPEILILDEPSSSLDSKNEEKIKNVLLNLKSKKITIILATHNRSMLETCDKIFRLENKNLKVIEKAEFYDTVI